jgi:O-succinylbenzoate synthase
VTELVPVERVEVLEVALPLLEPFVTSFGSTDIRHVVLVHLFDADGAEGWGEAAPLDHPFYLPDTVSGALALLVEYAVPMCLRAGVTSPADAAAAMEPIRGNTFARAGLEQAYWTLASARAGVSLAGLLGAHARRVPVGESIGLKPSVEAVVLEVRLRLEQGYRRIKLKVGPGWDVEVVGAVRQAVGFDVMLQVDANAAYTLLDVDVLRALDGFDLACIEQPLGFDDLVGHAALQRELSTPICLDESLRSPDDVRRALDLDACRNVNLKPGRVGGISASVEIEALCRSRGVPLWCGGMLESGIGRAANLALAALPGFVQPADMSPASVLYEEDLVDPTYTVDEDGFIAVPTEPGVGLPVVEERVRDRTVRRVELDGKGEVIRDERPVSPGPRRGARA